MARARDHQLAGAFARRVIRGGGEDGLARKQTKNLAGAYLSLISDLRKAETARATRHLKFALLKTKLDILLAELDSP
jgi:hypothetical protein